MLHDPSAAVSVVCSTRSAPTTATRAPSIGASVTRLAQRPARRVGRGREEVQGGSGSARRPACLPGAPGGWKRSLRAAPPWPPQSNPCPAVASTRARTTAPVASMSRTRTTVTVSWKCASSAALGIRGAGERRDQPRRGDLLRRDLLLRREPLGPRHAGRDRGSDGQREGHRAPRRGAGGHDSNSFRHEQRAQNAMVRASPQDGCVRSSLPAPRQTIPRRLLR